MTDSREARPSSPEKLLATAAAKVQVGAVCGVVLAAGAWLAPPVAPTTRATPEDHAAPLLEEQVQTRSGGRAFPDLQALAERVRGHGIGFAPETRRETVTATDFSVPADDSASAGFGVLVSDTDVISHARALDGRTTIRFTTPPTGPIDARVVASELATGLVLLRTSAASGTPAPVATAPPEPGSMAVAVGSSVGGHVVIPTFVTSVVGGRYAVGSALPPGLPLYTLEGQLLAIATGEGEAVAVGDAVDRLRTIAAANTREASLGIGFQPIGDELAAQYGQAAGVLVNEVIETGPADRAGLVPGDVLVAIGETELASTDIAARTIAGTTPGAIVPLRVRRGGDVRTVEATPMLAYETAALARRWAPLRPAGTTAHNLFSAESLDRADVRHEAHVLSINGRVMTSRAEIEREGRRSRRALVALVRDGERQFLAAIEARP